jgi:hypothetical protein
MNRKLKFLFLLAAFSFAATSLFAQTAPPKPAADNALLFEISGNGLKKPSYIFGTFHILCPADVMPMEKFTPYIDKVDQLVMEIDMDDPAEMQSIVAATRLSDGKSWKASLTPEQYAKVDAMFKEYVGVSADAMPNVQPTLLSVLILTSPKLLGCAPPSSYDLSLVKTAGTSKKPIVGLETAAFQGKALEAKPIDKQAQDLYEMSLDPQKSEDDLKKLIDAYRTQNLEKLNQISEAEEKKDPAYIEKLLDERNKDWIPKIESYIKATPSFIAVGAGHLGGKNGAISLLRARGYTVTAIRL